MEQISGINGYQHHRDDGGDIIDIEEIHAQTQKEDDERKNYHELKFLDGFFGPLYPSGEIYTHPCLLG